MRRAVRAFAMIAACLGLAAALPEAAHACSPVPIRSLRDLGPDQVFLVGTIGQRVANGRVFHVERAFNAGVPEREVVIVFQEGTAASACDMVAIAGTRLFIAPFRDGTGSLAANLATLQVDPDSESGRERIAEATALFGPGLAPSAEATTGPAVVTGLAVGAALALGLALVVLLRRRLRHRR